MVRLIFYEIFDGCLTCSLLAVAKFCSYFALLSLKCNLLRSAIAKDFQRSSILKRCSIPIRYQHPASVRLRYMLPPQIVPTDCQSSFASWPTVRAIIYSNQIHKPIRSPLPSKGSIAGLR